MASHGDITFDCSATFIEPYHSCYQKINLLSLPYIYICSEISTTDEAKSLPPDIFPFHPSTHFFQTVACIASDRPRDGRVILWWKDGGMNKQWWWIIRVTWIKNPFSPFLLIYINSIHQTISSVA